MRVYFTILMFGISNSVLKSVEVCMHLWRGKFVPSARLTRTDQAFN